MHAVAGPTSVKLLLAAGISLLTLGRIVSQHQVRTLALGRAALGSGLAHRLTPTHARALFGRPTTNLGVVVARAGRGEPAALGSPPPEVAASCPTGFNELVGARLRSDRRPIVAALTDKALVRTYASARNMTVAPLFFSGERCDAPELAALADAGDFALKATHTSGCVLLVEGGAVAAHKPCGERAAVGERATAALLRGLCARWTRTLYDPTQWGYTQLRPGVIAEGILRAPARDAAIRGASPARAADRQGWVVGGRTHVVQQVSERFADSGLTMRATALPSRLRGAFAALAGPRHAAAGGKRDTFYGRDGVARREVSIDGSRPLDADSPAMLPSDWLRSTVVPACDALGAGLDFARVDLYRVDDGEGNAGIALGEITMYPKAGTHSFSPAGFETELGAQWCAALEGAR